MLVLVRSACDPIPLLPLPSHARSLARRPSSPFRTASPGFIRPFHSSSFHQIDPNVHSFGRLVKAAIVEKDSKSRSGTSNKFLDEAADSTKEQAHRFDDKVKNVGQMIDAENVDMQVSSHKDDHPLQAVLKRQHDLFHASVAHAQDPCFSLRAQAKAYELHKKNKEFWNPARLANLFRIDIAKMRIYLWSSLVEEQAAAEGIEMDDTVDRVLAKRYGELDFPGDIANIPERIAYKKKRDAYFYLDDEVNSKEILIAMRKRDMIHYRESPRVPKRSIPPVKQLSTPLPQGFKQENYPGRFKSTWLMWDISPSKNLYNRDIVVRESDGSYRTGNWQERRYAEDYRRFLKWPMKLPFARPDETQPDHVPAEARVPEDYKVVFE